MRFVPFALLAACTSSQPDVITARQLPAAIQGDAAAVVAANHQFAIDVLHQQAATNSIFSPFWI
jgi:1-acyl-sn-glycerol-3-phosphate acyltransferase